MGMPLDYVVEGFKLGGKESRGEGVDGEPATWRLYRVLPAAYVATARMGEASGVHAVYRGGSSFRGRGGWLAPRTVFLCQ